MSYRSNSVINIEIIDIIEHHRIVLISHYNVIPCIVTMEINMIDTKLLSIKIELRIALDVPTLFKSSEISFFLWSVTEEMRDVALLFLSFVDGAFALL